MTKEYTNGELNVVRKPAKYIHAAVCVYTLLNVYDPNKNPWITPEDASIE
ncbi:(4Fe-4S)-binding protein [Vicingaceae bacterium]|nr:(4Fe-4S)-binding protein [Vicingaceae bacterium]MDB9964123.1 (4Fe-4S)-binding protein [Vicingaceae bacterium]